jgi:hypothetical protein
MCTAAWISLGIVLATGLIWSAAAISELIPLALTN